MNQTTQHARRKTSSDVVKALLIVAGIFVAGLLGVVIVAVANRDALVESGTAATAPRAKPSSPAQAAAAESAQKSGTAAPAAGEASGEADKPAEPEVETAYDKEVREAIMIDRAKEAVANQLKDPDSAKFRGVFVSGFVVCGEVNGKNGFGGYMGFQRFMSIGELATAFETQDANGTFEKTWDKSCIKQ